MLTGDATAGFATDWTGRFLGHAPAVVRPRDTAEVAAVLALCTEAGLPAVPQGAAQVTAGAGVILRRVAEADPDPCPLGRGAQVDVKIQARHRDAALPLCLPGGVWPRRGVARPVAWLAGLPCALAPGRGALAQ